jgi:hypothetical protein
VLSLISSPETSVYFPNILEVFRYKQQAKLFSSLFFGIFRRYGFSQLHANLFSKLMRILSYKKGLRMFRAVAEPELPRASSTMRRLSQMAFSTQNKQFF